jgi:hypothetical protein
VVGSGVMLDGLTSTFTLQNHILSLRAKLRGLKIACEMQRSKITHTTFRDAKKISYFLLYT